MPRVARALKQAEINNLKSKHEQRPTTYAVGGVSGLNIQITPSDTRSWLLITTVAGKRREIGLGGYPEVKLGEAIELARDAKRMIRRGIDPIAERKNAHKILIQGLLFSKTFVDVTDELLASKLDEFRNEKHRKQWRSTLENYAIPIIGGRPVSEITVEDVASVLRPIWSKKTETAKRLRGRIESVMAWATVHGYRKGDNPARWKGNLDAILPKPSKVSKAKNWPALALSDAPIWFSDVKARSGTATRALEFLAMCASRSGEVRGMTWDEINFDEMLWTIPADRMKSRKEHRVPLTESAALLLQSQPRQDGVNFVFPAKRGGMLSDMSLSACMKRINESHSKGYLDARTKRPAVPHGLRSTFRDWAAERTNYERDLAEIALAHTVGSEVERAYRRGDMIEKRRRMMVDWQQFIEGKSSPPYPS